MTDHLQLMHQVWACVEQAFVVGDLERAQSLERFLSALEELVQDEREPLGADFPVTRAAL